MENVILDLDGTLTRKDTLVSFSVFLKTIKPFIFLKFIFLLFLLKLNIISNVKFKKLYAKYCLKNVKKEKIKILIEKWFNHVGKNLIRRKLLDEIKSAKDIKIISANYDFIVEKFAKFIGAKDFIAIKLEIKEGLYTGNLLSDIPYGEKKLSLAIRKWGNNFIKNSIAFGDHISDKFILETSKNGRWMMHEEDLL